MAHTEQTVEQVTIGDRGRLVLPAHIREELGLHPGTRVALTIEPDGSLRLRSYRAIAEAARGMLADVGPQDRSPVDELIAERRREAAQEG
jgi:AbrB family looped-hinge helix DNA binding protein